MNNLILILFLCLVGHCIGDYVLQTDFIAKAKSPKFWKETNDKNGWIPVLIAHSLIWSFCTFVPLLHFYDENFAIWLFIYSFIINAFIHFFVDWLKCAGRSNMLIDQCIHLFQILITLLVLYLMKYTK